MIETQPRSPTPTPRAVPLRAVALPNEHGAWGFWLEPTLLGLLAAFSGAGVLVALGGLFAMLAQHPLSLVLADTRRGRAYLRTHLARRVFVLYGGIASFALALAAALGSAWLLAPLALAAPLALVQLHFDRFNRGRALVPELCGSLAVASLVAAIVLAAGASPALAAVLWLLLAGRNLPTILYVRARLRLERGAASWREAGGMPALVAALAAFIAAVMAVAGGMLPPIAAVVFGFLLARAALGLSSWRRPASAKAIGVREMLFGVAVVLLLGLGV
jgi:hypothetical protein